QPPSGLGTPRDCRGKPTARRRSEFRLDPKRVDQGYPFDRLLGELAGQPTRPTRASRHDEVLNIVHRQYKRGRRIGFAEYLQDARGDLGTRSSAPKLRRNSECQQPGFRQFREIPKGKTSISVLRARSFGEPGRKLERAFDDTG